MWCLCAIGKGKTPGKLNFLVCTNCMTPFYKGSVVFAELMHSDEFTIKGFGCYIISSICILYIYIYR